MPPANENTCRGVGWISPLRAVARFMHVQRAPAVMEGEARHKLLVRVQAVLAPVGLKARLKLAHLVPLKHHLDALAARWELRLALLRDPPKG